jgi:hypothetical protein
MHCLNITGVILQSQLAKLRAQQAAQEEAHRQQLAAQQEAHRVAVGGYPGALGASDEGVCQLLSGPGDP